MKGPEGRRFFTGADERIVRKEESLDNHELIERHSSLAGQTVMSSQLIASLEGEKFFERANPLDDEDAAFREAMHVLQNSPSSQSFYLNNSQMNVSRQRSWLPALAS